jgi:hypothetical protein
MEQEGLVRRGRGQPRTIIEPADPAIPAGDDEADVSLIGQLAAGIVSTPWSSPRRFSSCLAGSSATGT